MNKVLVLNFLEQINKTNKKILSELKDKELNDTLRELIEDEGSLTSALETYIKESTTTESVDKNERSEELLATMTELSKLIENVIKTLPSLKDDDDKVLNNMLTSSAINIVSKVLEISEKKKNEKK